MENQPEAGKPPVTTPAASKTPSPEVEKVRSKAARPRKSGGGSGLAVAVAFVALLVAAAAVGASGWLYLQLTEMGKALQASESRARDSIETLGEHPAFDEANERTRALAERVAQKFERVDASVATLDESLRKSREELMRDDRGWRLAEVDYLLRIAVHRLALLQDINGATAALETADDQLHRLANPVFLPLREQLRKDITTLSRIEQPDIPRVALQLEQLVDRVSELSPSAPAAVAVNGSGDSDAEATEASGWWQSLQRFVVVKRNASEMLSPTTTYQPMLQASTLMHTLRRAQNAALRNDDAEYQQLLAAARDSLTEHFNLEDRPGRSFTEDLDELIATPLKPVVPDISPTFALLEQLRTADQTEAIE